MNAVASVSIKSIMYELKNSYRVPAVIFGIGIFFAVGLELRIGIFESPMIFLIGIIVAPLVASICSFAVSKIYGNSKIFGRSYFLLGLAFFVTFVAETIFVYFIDLMNQDVPPFTEMLFAVSYMFMLSHLIINIKYFVEKLNIYQKTLLVLIPTVIILGYLYMVSESNVEINQDVVYDMIFVSLSALTVGFSVVGFTTFKQTALMTAWFLLLIGITVGTIGDLEYYYFEALEQEWLDNHAAALWITSNTIIVYALYRHQKSI